ncbi:MAG: ATP-binding protein [Oscillospiraceae bacterium]|nr:ATP-binding protein [Oscillospiraceae bacterium]
MAIKQPYELMTIDKKIRILIAGFPGICKTTLGLSAPKPLLIDTDRGIDRVMAVHRKPFIQPDSYEELLRDLTVENLTDFETLVFDTGGQLLKLMAEWAKRASPANGQKDGTLTKKGYGVIGKGFENLMNKAYYQLNKNVVVIFHAKEVTEDEKTKLRILVEGQTKDTVYQPMDLAGFIDMQGNRRIVEFGNTERHFGKCCHGISPKMEIPQLNEDTPNDFLTNLFRQINENIRKEAELCERSNAEYSAVMAVITKIIDSMTDIKTVKKAAENLKNINHVKTSLTESQLLFRKKLDELNLKYNKETGDYNVKPSKTETADNSQSA